MGRELKHVPLDFEWPVDKVWEGYLNPHYEGHCSPCPSCESGGSPLSEMLAARWYGKIPFDPAETGSEPFTPDTPEVWAAAKWYALREWDHGVYQTTTAEQDEMIRCEAERLAVLFNSRWCHHLSQQDVDLLATEHRVTDVMLYDLWINRGVRYPRYQSAGKPVSRRRRLGRRRLEAKHRSGAWLMRRHGYRLEARTLNLAYLRGMGHDAINQWIVVRAECERRGEPAMCAICHGSGDQWDAPENEKRAEDWQPHEPPAGDGYQMWETVSEGSPISPVFATAEELAAWLADHNRGMDRGTTAETWLKFIKGPGWSMSMVSRGRGLENGVQAMVTA